MRMQFAGMWLVIAACLAASLPGADGVPVVATIPEIEAGITVIEDNDVGGGFGWYARPLGDFNGDGRDDIAFLAEGWRTAPENVSYVLFGRETLPPRLELSRFEEWGMRIHATPGRRYSLPVAGIGDINGDGVDDMIFNVCYATETCPSFILFGGQELPRDVTTDELESSSVCGVYPDQSLETGSSALGFSSFASGDLDGDGTNDLVCGAGNVNRPGQSQGEGIVYVVRGSRPFPSSIDLADVGAVVAGTRLTAVSSQGPIGGVSPHFGERVTCGKDFDRDGFQDPAIAAPLWPIATGEAEAAGAVFVVFGRSVWPASLDVLDVGASRVCRIFSRTVHHNLGDATLAAIDDVTGDEAPDLLISGGSSCYLVSGAELVPGDFVIDDIATTFFPYAGLGAAAGAAIGDWNGDGRNDLVFGLPSGSLNSGMVCVLEERAAYPYPCALDGPLDGLTRIVGHTTGAHLGACVTGGDLNGDGRPELVVGSVGGSFHFFLPIPPDPTDPPGRLYVIPGALEFLGPFEAYSFDPKTSDLAGGGQLVVRGRGFDAATSVWIGDTSLEILARPDSRTIVARIPAAAAAAVLPVKVTGRGQTVVLNEQFEYFGSVFPFELDLKDLGAGGMGLFDSQYGSAEESRSFDTRFVQGRGDFTGDGRADVVCELFALFDRCGVPRPGRVFLIHGVENLPQTLTTDTIAPYATILTSTDPEDMFGYSADLAGDMTGDGVSELLVAAPLAGRVYVLFGGEIQKGEVAVQSLVAAGRGVVIEDCPVLVGDDGCRSAGIYLVALGDVNGDGLREAGIVTSRQPGFGGEPGKKDALVVVPGSAQFAPVLSFNSLPRIEPPTSPLGGEDVYFPTVRSVGDVDGDGFDDVYVYSVAGTFAMQSVFFGRRGLAGSLPLDNELTSGDAIEIQFTPSDWAGDLHGIGDQNGDGKDDLGVDCSWAAPDCCTPTSAPPKFFLRILYSGTRQGLALPRDISGEADFDATFPQADDSMQWLLLQDWGYDLNADGRTDILLIQRRYFDKGLPDRATALFGGDLESKAGVLSDVQAACRVVDHSPYVGSGFYGFEFRNYHFAGDVNGDGYEDTVLRTAATLWIYFNPLGAVRDDRPFVRGDSNQDGKINIADAVRTLQFLFAHGRVLPCMDAGDANDDEQLNIADAVKVLGHLFGSGPGRALPPPNECGSDPEGDSLDCRESVCR